MREKLKQLTKDTAVYGLSTIVGRFLNFLLVPLYTNVFLPSEYGVIANIYAFIAIFNIIYLYGMDSAYLRFASTLELGNKKENFSTPFISILASGMLLSTLIILIKDSMLKAAGVPQTHEYVIYYFAAILFFDALTVTPFIGLRLERNAKKFALIKTVSIIINVILNVVLTLKFKFGIEAVFISNLAASIFSLVALLGFIKTNIVFSFNTTLFKRLFKFGIPYLPAGLASMFVQVINRPILQMLTDLKTVGIFQANYRLGIFMMLFASMFQFAWQPFFMANSKEINAKEIFAKVLTYFTLLAGLILVTLSIFIDDIAKFHIFGKSLIGSAYWSGLNIVPIVLLGYLFNGLYINFTAGIYIKEKSNYVPLVTGVGAAVNIGSNFLLIPAFGLMGAAYTTLLSYLILAAGLFWVTQKFYPIRYEYEKLLKIFLSIVLVGIAFYYLRNNDLLFWFNKIGLLLSFIAVIILSKVFDKNELDFLMTILKRFRIIK